MKASASPSLPRLPTRNTLLDIVYSLSSADPAPPLDLVLGAAHISRATTCSEYHHNESRCGQSWRIWKTIPKTISSTISTCRDSLRKRKNHMQNQNEYLNYKRRILNQPLSRHQADANGLCRTIIYEWRWTLCFQRRRVLEKGASGSSSAWFSARWYFKDGRRQDGGATVGDGLSEEGEEGTTGKCEGVEETGQPLK